MVDAEAATPIEVAELRFRRGCGSRPRRVVLTRRRDAETPHGHLGDAAGYHDAAYVTAGDWAPEDVGAFSDKRADLEKAIPELKADFGIDRIPSRSFGANAADLELKVLAFNLLVLSQRPALGCASLQRAKTRRRRLLAIAGRLIRTAGPWRLQLAQDWAGQGELARVRHHLATIGP